MFSNIVMKAVNKSSAQNNNNAMNRCKYCGNIIPKYVSICIACNREMNRKRRKKADIQNRVTEILSIFSLMISIFTIPVMRLIRIIDPKESLGDITSYIISDETIIVMNGLLVFSFVCSVMYIITSMTSAKNKKIISIKTIGVILLMIFNLKYGYSLVGV